MRGPNFSQRKFWEPKLRKTDEAEKETKVLKSEDLKIMWNSKMKINLLEIVKFREVEIICGDKK